MHTRNLLVRVGMLVGLSLGLLASGDPPRGAPDQALPPHAQATHAFQKLHYTDQLAFMVKHLEHARAGRSPAQVTAINTILAAFDVKAYAKDRDPATHRRLQAVIARARPAFAPADWDALGHPSLLPLLAGVRRIRQDEAEIDWQGVCLCSSTTGGCNEPVSMCYGGRCTWWPAGCGWAWIEDCDSTCRLRSEAPSGLARPCADPTPRR
jgi:hypothetical protein